MFTDISVINSSGFEASQAQQLDYLINQNFRLVIPNCPILSQTATKFSLPELIIGVARQKTPTLSIPLIADKLNFGSLTIHFPVLSDLSNYLEVWNWMNAIVTEDLIDAQNAAIQRINGIGQSNQFASSKITDNVDKYYVDSSVILYNRSNNPTITYEFYGIVPSMLSNIKLDATSTSQEPVYATATFEYILHKISKST